MFDFPSSILFDPVLMEMFVLLVHTYHHVKGREDEENHGKKDEGSYTGRHI
jgi:hypothetical protein